MTGIRRLGSRIFVACLAATALVAGSGPAGAAGSAGKGAKPAPSLPSVDSGHRPGPDILYAPPPRAPQLENVKPWRAEPILISGASAYRSGEFLYQDWLHDDRGAAGLPDPTDPHGPLSGYTFSPKHGSLTYPTSPDYASNAADIVEFRARPLKRETAFRLTFNTLIDPDLTGFTIAIGDSEQPRDWPHNAGVSSPARFFLTVHDETAELRDADGGMLVAPAPTATVDLERRQVDVRVPHAAWNPGRDTVRLAAGAGLWDAASGGYLVPELVATETTPGGAAPNRAALFNVAFRAGEPMPEFQQAVGRTIVDAAIGSKAQAHWWNERAQADALAGGDISEFHSEVDFAKLGKRVTDEAGIPATGHMNRILASRFSFGQGVDHDKACGGLQAIGGNRCDGAIVGQLQPYTVYIPQQAEPSAGYGLTLLLHALSANHNQYLGSRHAEQLGERGPGSIVITPGGRGPDGFYYDVAEADTFEVWADIARRYRLERTGLPPAASPWVASGRGGSPDATRTCSGA